MELQKENDLYIEDLFNAVKTVKSEFVKYRHINGLSKIENLENEPFFGNDIEKGIIDKSLLKFLDEQKKYVEKSLEAVFCYELYHRWKEVMRSHSGRYVGKLVLNGEIGKTNLSQYIKNYNNSKNSKLFSELSLISILENGNLFPDFTLHGGNDNIENQKMIVEVKTDENIEKENFKKDFYRLAVFQKIYGFEIVVFIILNKKIKDLVSYLDSVDTDLVDKKSFYFILKSESDYCFKLDDIK